MFAHKLQYPGLFVRASQDQYGAVNKHYSSLSASNNIFAFFAVVYLCYWWASFSSGEENHTQFYFLVNKELSQHI